MADRASPHAPNRPKKLWNFPISVESNILYTGSMPRYSGPSKMQIDILSYADLTQRNHAVTVEQLKDAILQQGIVGIRHTPYFEQKYRTYITAARHCCISSCD